MLTAAQYADHVWGFDELQDSKRFAPVDNSSRQKLISKSGNKERTEHGYRGRSCNSRQGDLP